jgi:hypothetical protein
MLSLPAKKGHVALRKDIDKAFILTDSDPTNILNWTEVLSANNQEKLHTSLFDIITKDGNVDLSFPKNDWSPRSSKDLGELAYNPADETLLQVHVRPYFNKLQVCMPAFNGGKGWLIHLHPQPLHAEIHEWHNDRQFALEDLHFNNWEFKFGVAFKDGAGARLQHFFYELEATVSYDTAALLKRKKLGGTIF